jgi:hypothetical protein
VLAGEGDVGDRGRNNPNNVCAYEYMNKEKKRKHRESSGATWKTYIKVNWKIQKK